MYFRVWTGHVIHTMTSGSRHQLWVMWLAAAAASGRHKRHNGLRSSRVSGCRLSWITRLCRVAVAPRGPLKSRWFAAATSHDPCHGLSVSFEADQICDCSLVCVVVEESHDASGHSARYGLVSAATTYGRHGYTKPHRPDRPRPTPLKLSHWVLLPADRQQSPRLA